MKKLPLSENVLAIDRYTQAGRNPSSACNIHYWDLLVQVYTCIELKAFLDCKAISHNRFFELQTVESCIELQSNLL